MAKKFDTNRLDPDFPQKARETAAASEVRPRFETAEFPLPPGSVTEDETRRFSADELNRTAMPAQQGPLYRPPTAPAAVPGDRPVASTGIPEKWLLGLSYFPFTIGLVAGIILLLVIPKEETRVRFHAAQGLAAHFGILIVTAILRAIDKVTDLADVGLFAFSVVTTIMLIIFSIKAWRGKPVHIESLDSLTNWLVDKIGPFKH